MDRFAAGMIARGPTLAVDRETWTGSLHILDLPSVEAAHAFVEHEPYNRAGLFADHLIRGFENLLGRMMWESPGVVGEPRFLVIAQARSEGRELAPLSALATRSVPRVSVHGRLFTPDGAEPVGVALALQAPSREAVESLLPGGADSATGDLDVAIHDWEFGGRR